MAAQRNQASGSVLAKVKQAINPLAKKHATDEIDYGFQTLPGGIRNGVARLSEAYFDVFKTGTNKGQPFLRMVGVVEEPEVHDGERVRDRTTSVMVPICPVGQGDSAKSLEDQVEAVQNELKKLGADPSSVEDTDGWEATVTLLASNENACPYFYFDTRLSPETLWTDGPNKGQVKYKERVWESWRGIKGLENYTPETGGTGSGMDVKQSEPETPPRQVTTTAAKPQAAPGRQPPKSPPPVATVAPEEYRDDADLDSLAERADQGDDEAIKEVGEQLERLGITEEQIQAVNSWAEAVALTKGDAGQEAGGDGEATEWTPAVDEIYKYQPRDAKGLPLKDPKTKKLVKAEEVVITVVDDAARTVDFKFNKTKKPVKGVAWDDLVRDE